MHILLKTLLASATLLSANLYAAEIELTDVFHITSSRYGMTSTSNTFLVTVDKLSEDQTVFVHHELQDGTWKDYPMYFYRSAGNGKAQYRISLSQSDLSDEFVVATTANGATYWDNNEGENYTIIDQGYLLGNGKKVVVDYYYTQSSYTPDLESLSATLVLDNIAPSKDVKLTYSTDGWNTSTTVDARYGGPFVGYAYGSYENPNANGAETWFVTTEVPAGVKGEFFVSYTVNGTTYYANNYDANYTFNYDSLYGSMNLRRSPAWSSGMPMTLVGDNLWSATAHFFEDGYEFKFDAYNDWTVNFGDNEGDGIAEQNGTNIIAPESYQEGHILFNEVTGEYSITPLN